MVRVPSSLAYTSKSGGGVARLLFPLLTAAAVAFLMGCFLTASMLSLIHDPSRDAANVDGYLSPSFRSFLAPSKTPSRGTDGGIVGRRRNTSLEQRESKVEDSGNSNPAKQQPSTSRSQSVLENLRILVALVAFDFSQLPHLEEVLDSYHDVCLSLASASSTGSSASSAGPKVDVVIHATVAYPVTLIDMLNTRYYCPNWSLTIVLKPQSLRLHLVDCHRKMFYDHIDDYDLFIYSEDDIRVTTTTVVTYLEETRNVQAMVEGTAYDSSDFNVGIVRYEYNYPSNVIIDDNTRHATQNVTRVYWEHSGAKRPVVPNAVEEVSKEGSAPDRIRQRYVTMKNHHQGMYLATRELLKAWKVRTGCDFANARDRPGRGPQPTEGTQRVWMSSQMLYGKRHCGVVQVLPKSRFPALTVLHLPNKNYRRVGKYRQRKFADGSEVFEKPHESLLSAMELHLAMRRAFPASPGGGEQRSEPYSGIKMVDEVNIQRDRSPLLERRMREYFEYVDRGGVLSQEDMTKTALVEEQ